jgi:hypothetical protein
MDTRSCAYCGDPLEGKRSNVKYCSESCKGKSYYQRNKDNARAYYENNKDKIKAYGDAYREQNRDKLRQQKFEDYWSDPERHRAYSRKYAAKKEASSPPRPKPEPRVWKYKAQQRYYENVIVPRGQRLQELLDNLFRSQASTDPSRLPQLASRVLSWRPKGYIAAIQYAVHPYGPLEADWLYYADYTPGEAVVVYARED